MILLAAVIVGAAQAGSLYHEAFVAARLNPLGQSQELAVGWRERVLPDDGTLMRKQSYVWVGAKTQVAPTFAAVGGFLRLVPASVAQLHVHVERTMVWAETDDIDPNGPLPITQATLEMIEAAGATLGNGWRTTNSLLLQLKAGPIAARSTATLAGWRMDRSEDGQFYDQTYDFVAPDRGWGFNLDMDLLAVAPGQRPIFGLRYTAATPLADVPGWPGGALQRAGPLVAWTFNERHPGGVVSEPTVFVLSQWHLVHPWRTGEPTSQGMPYLGLGFAMNGYTVGDDAP